MVEFVERNGGTVTHPAGDLNATATTIRRLAGDPPQMSEGEFVEWVASRVR